MAQNIHQDIVVICVDYDTTIIYTPTDNEDVLHSKWTQTWTPQMYH